MKIPCFLLLVFSGLVNAQGTWKQKTDFPGGARWCSFSFAIGNKGYLGTGTKNYDPYPNTGYSDFWEYDPAANSWTQKADYGGGPMRFGIGFSIGNKGYAGIGESGFGGGFDGTNDFWEYDPAANLWAQKKNMPGGYRCGCGAFVIGSKGYIVTGTNWSSFYYQDMFEYDPATDTWTQKANFPPGSRSDIDRLPFVIQNKAYVGMGSSFTNDIWAYDPSTDNWTQKANIPVSGRIGATGFSICNFGYVGLGSDGNYSHSDLWKYDPYLNTWSVADSLPASPRGDATVFVINGKAYVGTGEAWGSSSALNDFWEFTPDGPTSIIATVSSHTTICLGRSALLSASGGDNYFWNTNETNASITVTPQSTTTYSVVATNRCGSDTASVTVKIEENPCVCSKEELFIPNAFSPNGDQENDVLKLFYGHMECIKTYHFILYNRLGELVFETTNPFAEWDGSHNGEKENSGVFTYYLEAGLSTDTIVRKKGNISLCK